VHVPPGESLRTSTASPRPIVRSAGSRSLQYIASSGSFDLATHLSNLVVAAAVLISALLLRSAFCTGSVRSDSFRTSSRIQRWIQKRFVPYGKLFAASIAVVLRRGLFSINTWLREIRRTGLAVTGAAIYGVMVFRDYDPWSALINIAEWTYTPGLVVLGLTLVGSFFVERPWCAMPVRSGGQRAARQAEPGLPQAGCGFLYDLQDLHQCLSDGSEVHTARRSPAWTVFPASNVWVSVRAKARWKSASACHSRRNKEIKMRINPFVYGVIVVALFMGIIYGFQGAGVWSTSGKVTGSGERVAPSASDVNSIKGG